MMRYRDTGSLQGLERRPFRPILDYSLPNPIEESGMKQLAKLLLINVKMYGELGPSWASVLVTSTSISAAMATSTEKTHPTCVID
jgi:hypothetical protein